MVVVDKCDGFKEVLKGEYGLFFNPCVNAAGWRPYWPLDVWKNSDFSEIIWHDLRTLLLAWDSTRDNLHVPACMI